MASTDIKDYYRRSWGLGDRVPFKYGGTWADWKVNYEDQMTFEEYLQDDKITKKLHALDKRADGGRIGYNVGDLVFEDFTDRMTVSSRQSKGLEVPEKDKFIKKMLKGKSKDWAFKTDSVLIKQADIDNAFKVRNYILNNKGFVPSVEFLGKELNIMSGEKIDHRAVKKAVALAKDTFKGVENFKFAASLYPRVDAKKFKYLKMVANSFADYKNTANATEAAASLLPNNMVMHYPLGSKEAMERGFFNLRVKLKPADKKFLSDRISELTGKSFSIDDVNKTIDITEKVRRSTGSIAAQIKRNASMNSQIKSLYNDLEIQKLIKSDLNPAAKKRILERAVEIVGDDVSIASRRLFQMAQAIQGDSRLIDGIKINKDLGNKIINTQRLIGKTGNGYAFSSLVYDHYGKVIDKALGATPGKSFIGYYQNEIKKALNKGIVPDEIFSVTASARRGMSPYAIFTQKLTADVNSKIKGSNLDSALSTTHKKLQEIFQGRKWNQLNKAEKLAAQTLVDTFENTKANVLKDLKPDIKANLKLAEFDLKNPPSKSISQYSAFDKNLQKAFDQTYKNVGYSMKVPKDFQTQKQLLKNVTGKTIAKKAAKSAGAKVLYPAMVANALLFGDKFSKGPWDFPLTPQEDAKQMNELATMIKDKFSYFDGGIASLKK